MIWLSRHSQNSGPDKYDLSRSEKMELVDLQRGRLEWCRCNALVYGLVKLKGSRCQLICGNRVMIHVLSKLGALGVPASTVNNTANVIY